MDSENVQKPLLSSLSPVEDEKHIKTSFLASSSKLFLKSAMWTVFILWVSLILVFPAEFSNGLLKKWIVLTEGTIFGVTGSIFLLCSAPIFFISLLSALYLIISGEDEEFTKNKTSRYPKFRLWTFPVIVNGPFGVVSAAELIGILVFVVYIIWAIYVYAARIIHGISGELNFSDQSYTFLKVMGLRLGAIGMWCLGFLFIPIARGSVLLQIIDIPFEHATRYHVWLGHLTMIVFTLHGLCYVIGWTLKGRLLMKLLEWKDIGIANLAGVISLAAGLLMWLTSLPPVRKSNFELFFYTHQLYVVFIVFFALHVGDFIFCFCVGPIFLFMLDRFLRFCQSRRTVEIISAKCLPCGTVELMLSKPASLRYNALSFVFVQIRELSWLQWHPFSVSSSPLDGNHHMSILIKVLGKWTKNLRENILNDSEAVLEEELPLNSRTKCLTASVEGPYGHEKPYHLMYENLVLVAGGIGISPFLAILSDVLHRVRDGKPCFPRNISIIWAVKKSSELPLLSTVDMESICPFYSDKLKIEFHIYVTRESEPQLEEGNLANGPKCAYALSPSKRRNETMSSLVGTGHRVWSGLYLLISSFGFIALMGLCEEFYIIPHGIRQWWYKGLILITCMALSILVFGGSLIGLWHLWETKKHDNEDFNVNVDETSDLRTKSSNVNSVTNRTCVTYGARPDFKEILEKHGKKWGCVNVGVIVCGPHTLQTSVAGEVRSHNLTRHSHHPIFHFNSHSFDL